MFEIVKNISTFFSLNFIFLNLKFSLKKYLLQFFMLGIFWLCAYFFNEYFFLNTSVALSQLTACKHKTWGWSLLTWLFCAQIFMNIFLHTFQIILDKKNGENKKFVIKKKFNVTFFHILRIFWNAFSKSRAKLEQNSIIWSFMAIFWSIF